MADSHTPGPWEHDDDCWVFALEPSPSGGIQHRFWASANCDLHVPREERIANARLIAAAPCLLDALRNLLRETDPITVGCPGIQRAREAARAAIAKAEGVSGG